MEIGSTLREARLSKGYSFQDVEEATKIRARYLEALEEENFDILPGRVYAIAFLRSYAKFLGLNDEELVVQYKEQYREQQNGNKAEKELTADNDAGEREAGKPRYITYLVLALLIIGVVFAAVTALNNTKPDQTGEPEIVNNDNRRQEISARPEKPQRVETPAPGVIENNNVELVLNVVDDRCWMKIDVDGKTEFMGIVQAGERKEFTGQESIYVVLGNAGVVEVLYNGENLGALGKKGQTLRREFTTKQS
ncbi:cytoskeletal protein RodZ [Desulfohalotomaculum tongense]|uniref:helix-turn-helix domain-containing protein n=1 Tax=Desulforadius tongensis TaxID=1216062 RepID=UPI00195EF74C|nr:helix-turn-helix domain-containing protein [Desulforadius tongensis]MBM7854468.1 cytoskeletal protein RodZ [Desulforadius tongensis]